MVAGSGAVGVLTTVVAALFAIYAFQVSLPTTTAVKSVESLDFGAAEDEFCSVSGPSGDSKCSETGSEMVSQTLV